MGKLTTHVLDTTHGRPGHGIRIELFRLERNERLLVKEAVTNDDGRCDEPLLADAELRQGVYELVFGAGAYFREQAPSPASGAAGPAFLDEVVIRFGVAEPDQHYHVPLLISPFSYSTYRGS